MTSPQLELEYAVLGSIIDDSNNLNKVSGILTHESFSDNGCSEIFKAMLSLNSKGNPVDEVSVKEELGFGLCVSYGDVVDSLIDCASASGDIFYFSRLINENWIARELSKLGKSIQSQADDPQSSITDILETAQSQIFSISDRSKTSTPQNIKSILPGVFKRLELQSSPDFKPVRTGFHDVDKVMFLDPGTYTILAARPSMGKTSLATSMMTFIAEDNPDEYCLFFSIEMRKENIGAKMLSQHARVDLRRIRTEALPANEWDKLSMHTDRLSKLSNLIIIDNPKISVNEMQTIATNYSNKKKLSAIFVDYMQIIQPPTHTIKHGRVQEVTAISSCLKQMARILDVPLIVLSQLSRKVEERTDKRPVNSDLRDSGSIEQDADNIAFIYRDEVYNDESKEKGIAQILIRKNREGPTGKVRVRFAGEYTKFSNLNEPDYGV